MTIEIYHNPRCSKSRQTLALLEEHGVKPTIIEYLKKPLSADEIKSIIHKLGFSSARELMRTKETEYKEQGLKDVTDENVLINAMVSTPKLIERPIVINGEQAKIGRPPEQTLDII